MNGSDSLVSMVDGRALSDLFACAFDLLVVLDTESLRIRWIDPSGRTLLGISEGEAGNQPPWLDCLAEEGRSDFLHNLLPALASFSSWKGDLVLRRRDGVHWPVQIFASNLRNEADAGLAVLGAIDRADLVDTLATLRHEQMLLRALLDRLPDAVYFKDLQSRFIRVGAAMALKTGCRSPADLIGKTDFDYFTAEHAQCAFEDEQKIIGTGEAVVAFEEKETWPDGHVTWVSSTKVPLRDLTGRMIGTFGISRDITARKQAEADRQDMEQQLQLATKLESIGRLAAGIAHEVNTPTQFINDNTHFLVSGFGGITKLLSRYRAFVARADACPSCAEAARAMHAGEVEAEVDYMIEEIPRALEQTLEGVARIARIVRSLKEFSHPGAPERSPNDLNRAIETTVAVSRHEWKYVAEVSTDLDPDLPLVPCVVDQINQVLLNLIVNAAHAIGDAVADSGEKGRITLRTRADEDWVTIEVEDTGTGIPPDVGGRIFDPFFTTKPMGKGTGQGLSIVQTIIVTNHRGTVDFTTEAGKGTTFRIRLPITIESPPSAIEGGGATPTAP